MHRTGLEHALWHLVREMRWDRAVAPGLVALWLTGWVGLVLALFAPLS
jgi:hypothetical protein